MRNLLITLLAIIGLETTYAQVVSHEITEGNLTYVLSDYDGGMSSLVNKTLTLRETGDKNKYRNMDRSKLENATYNTKITTPDSKIASAIKSIFTKEELSALKDEKVRPSVRVSGAGNIIYVVFYFKTGGKFSELPLQKVNRLEKTLMNTIKYTQEKEVDFYLKSLPEIKFNNLINDTPLFPPGAYK